MNVPTAVTVILTYEPTQGSSESSIGEEWKVPKWAKEECIKKGWESLD